jgi:hypothetical protein
MVFKKFSVTEIILLVLYSLLLLGLFLYSFVQIDLSLTISRVEFLQNIVRSFQQIGYFQRPLSTALYVCILILLFIFYGVFLYLSKKKILQKKYIWVLLGISAVLLTFSYTAFSYDIFNYIFDAKIITHYHQNPYLQKALDYPHDPMLSFMRWTHRVYPYGPVWLGLTVPLSFIGLQFFLPTYFLFKFLMTAAFLGSCYFIGKILQKVAPEREVLGLVLFGLNPLVLIESLVSSHLDIVMMFFSLWALYVFIKNRFLLSYGLLILSIGIKFVTVFIAPIFLLLQLWLKRGQKINWEIAIVMMLIPMIIGVILETTRGNFQAWYLLAVMPFAAFLAHRYYIVIPAFIISFFAMLTYVPFFFTGNWDPPIPTLLSDIYLFSYSLSFFIVALYFGYQQIVFAKRHKKSIIGKK